MDNGYKRVISIISSEQAKEIALKQAGGNVVDLRLEEMGDKYEYQVKLKNDHNITTMTIDAATGDVRIIKV